MLRAPVTGNVRPVMRLIRLSLVITALLPSVALADWFYAAAKIACDSKTDTLIIVNASAYNEAGIQKADERRGIYIPERNWPKANGVPRPKEHRCKTPSAEFIVRLSPVFARLETGDTLEVAVVRNGHIVLEYTSLDSDPDGLDPSSYVTSITVPASGEPVIHRSCQAKVHLGIKCRGEGPNSPIERTR